VNTAAALRRLLLLLAPLVGAASILLLMLAGDLFLGLIMIDEPLPFQIRALLMALLLGIAGAVTAYVTLLLEPKHKIRVALILAAVWTTLLFYFLLMNGLTPWNRGSSTATWIALRALMLALTASAGGLLVVYLFKRTSKTAQGSPQDRKKIPPRQKPRG
jgi:hypothetical protein